MIAITVRPELVEAPGTAPGSALLIPYHVYRHSQDKPDKASISPVCIKAK